MRNFCNQMALRQVSSDFSFPLQNILPQNRVCSPPRLLFSGHQGYFPRVKRAGRDVNHSSPSSAEFKNEWSYTSALLICLHGLYRDNFTFTFIPATVLHTRLSSDAGTLGQFKGTGARDSQVLPHSGN
jgi:hypothetical protein